MIIDFIIEDLMLNSYLQKNFHTLSNSSRCHEEINNAYNMCCYLLNLKHMKIKPKKKQ